VPVLTERSIILLALLSHQVKPKENKKALGKLDVYWIALVWKKKLLPLKSKVEFLIFSS